MKAIDKKKNIAAVTICAINYLAKAMLLRNTYMKYNSGESFFIVIVDKRDREVEEQCKDYDIIWVEDLSIPKFEEMAFKFDIIELCTSIKPFVLIEMLKKYNNVYYIDPDIAVYSSFIALAEYLNSWPVIVTPHTCTPIHDGYRPDDIDFIRFGSYNLGFIGVSDDNRALEFLAWWSDRLFEFCYYEPQTGLAVDQKWIDLAIAIFPFIYIVRNLGCNVAFWNLHERNVEMINDEWMVNRNVKLIFFHFSSFNPERPELLANKQTRFIGNCQNGLRELLVKYSFELQKLKNDYYTRKVYSYDYFDSGEYITPILRRLLDNFVIEYGEIKNLFSNSSKLHSFAKEHRLLLKSTDKVGIANFKDIDKHRREQKIFGSFLKIALWILGPNKYYYLMRYFAHISSIANQKDVFFK